MKIGSVELKTLHPQYGGKSGCLTAAIFNNQVRTTEGAELLKLAPLLYVITLEEGGR